MKQLSSFFVVVGETPNFSVCETVCDQYIWRFVIEWDEDRDLRIVDVINHLISTHCFSEYDVTTIGESKGCLNIWSYLGQEQFFDGYSVNGDQWFVIVNDREDVVGKALGAGARRFVDVVSVIGSNND